MALIDKETAIEALKGLPTWWADEGGYYGGAQPPMVALLDPEDAVSAIENLPSAQPEQRWIPCRERLPETGSFFVTFKEEFDEAVDIDFYDAENEMWYYHDSDLVIAWMPLPEPYKAERREE